MGVPSIRLVLLLLLGAISTAAAQNQLVDKRRDRRGLSSPSACQPACGPGEECACASRRRRMSKRRKQNGRMLEEEQILANSTKEAEPMSRRLFGAPAIPACECVTLPSPPPSPPRLPPPSLPPPPRQPPSMPPPVTTIYILGGGTALNVVQQYDVETDSFTTLSSTTSNRQYFGAGYINGFLYAVGGRTASSTAERLDVSTPGNAWTAITATSVSRDQTCGAALGGKFYMTGGCSPSNQQTAEVYDPSTDLWTALPNMPSYHRA